MNQICMSCKFFKIEDEFSGYCKKISKTADDGKTGKHIVKQDDSCGQWKNCGQQYYIRLGWVKARQKQESDKIRQ